MMVGEALERKTRGPARSRTSQLPRTSLWVRLSLCQTREELMSVHVTACACGCLQFFIHRGALIGRGAVWSINL